MVKSWVIIMIGSTLVIIGAIGGYSYHLYHRVKTTATQIYQPVDKEKSDLRQAKVSVTTRDPISVLLMGVDERQNDHGRSDSLVVLSVNPNTKSILMFNIPRDTRTEISGMGVEDKINHAYAFGGVKMAINTVEKFLNVPVDYYVEVNMEEFVNIIDLLDGVDIHNKFAFQEDGYSFKEGNLHLDGTSALEYSRMRYEDPKGDLGRNERQRQILKALMQKATSPGILGKIGNILEDLGTSLKTNVTFDEMRELSDHYRPAIENIISTEVKGQGTMIDGIYYYIVTREERDRISSKMKEQLELK